MKLSQPLKLGIALLGVMLAAGIGTGVLAYKIGYTSLKGVSQPDINPTKKFTNDKKVSARPKAFTPVNEKDIIKTVETYIREKKANPKPSPEVKSDNNVSDPKKSQEPIKNIQIAKFPLKTQAQGVTLEIVQSTHQGSDVLLDVNLKNEGTEAINFLYSFLEIKDEQGQVLSGIIDGLPEELPANGETFTGTIKIPMASFLQKNSLTIRLTDYPEQTLELSLANIPVIQ